MDRCVLTVQNSSIVRIPVTKMIKFSVRQATIISFFLPKVYGSVEKIAPSTEIIVDSNCYVIGCQKFVFLLSLQNK